MLRNRLAPEQTPLAFLPPVGEEEAQGDRAVAGSCSCSGCARMPLLGELVSLVERRDRREWLCELCLTADGGRWTEVRQERVHAPTARLVVRRISG